MSQTSQTFNRVADNLYRTGEGTYFARFSFEGKQYKKSLKTHDRKQADRELAAFVKKIEAKAVEAPDITFEDAARRWLDDLYELKPSSKLRRETSLKSITPKFRGHKLRTISKKDVFEWAADRAKGVSPRSFNIDRETFSLVLDYAKETLGIVETNHAKALPKMKPKRSTVVPPTREQFAELVAYLDKSKRLNTEDGSRNAALFVRFLAYSGVRLDEARNVLWKHVDIEKNTLLIAGGNEGTKNYKERTIPLFPALRELLERFPKSQRKAFFRVFNICTAKEVLKTASKAIGKPKGEHFVHHDMRHFFCSNAIELLIPDHVIANWLGHKDGGVLVKTTYGHLRKSFGDAEALKMTFAS